MAAAFGTGNKTGDAPRKLTLAALLGGGQGASGGRKKTLRSRLKGAVRKVTLARRLGRRRRRRKKGKKGKKRRGKKKTRSVAAARLKKLRMAALLAGRFAAMPQLSVATQAVPTSPAESFASRFSQFGRQSGPFGKDERWGGGWGL